MGGRLGVWKGVLWVFFRKDVLLDYLDRTLMGRINGCELGSLDGFSLGIF